MRGTRSIVGCLLALPVLLLAGCDRGASSERASSPAPPAPIVIPIDVDPGLVDPLRASDPRVARVSVLLHEGLCVLDDSVHVRPGVARHWELTHRGKRLRLELDPRARFAAGRRVEPRDVRFTLERLLDPRSASPCAVDLGRLEGASAFRSGKVDSVSGIVLVDSATVELRFAPVAGAILTCLADPAAAVVPDGLGPGEVPPGLGPWEVAARVPGRSLTLVHRAGYHGETPRWPELELRVIDDAWHRRQAFESGAIDLLELAPGLPPPTGRLAPHVVEVTDWSVLAIAINCRKYPFDRWRVRQALNYAIDVQPLIDELLGGAGRRAAGPLSPTLPGDAAGLECFRHDPAWARELLQAAGFARGFHFEVWYEDGPLARRVLEALQHQLRRVGVELEPVAASARDIAAAIDAGTLDAALCRLRPGMLGAHAFLDERFHSGRFGATGNVARYESRGVDRLLGRMRRTYDAGDRDALARQLEEQLHEAAPWVYLWHPERRVALAPGIAGYRIAPDPRLERFLSIGRQEAGGP
ncbi:MAG: ABC transporter substrate-binding protein [Candidatus Eiseniibacteriota bacterium]|jgi:peptide/nickel transport system substrate-binding protein